MFLKSQQQMTTLQTGILWKKPFSKNTLTKRTAWKRRFWRLIKTILKLSRRSWRNKSSRETEKIGDTRGSCWCWFYLCIWAISGNVFVSWLIWGINAAYSYKGKPGPFYRITEYIKGFNDTEYGIIAGPGFTVMYSILVLFTVGLFTSGFPFR